MPLFRPALTGAVLVAFALPARAEEPETQTLPPSSSRRSGSSRRGGRTTRRPKRTCAARRAASRWCRTRRIERTRAASFEDVLEAVPGVFVRQRGTGEEPQISIRGSGLRNNFHTRGVNVLLDGFPVPERRRLQRRRVVRVPRARARGGAEGRDLAALRRECARAARSTSSRAPAARPPRLRLRSEGGAFGFSKSFAESGFATEDLGRLPRAQSHAAGDGYRATPTRTASDSTPRSRAALEGGGELRFDANAMRNRQELPGALTREEFHANPEQANPASAAQDERRDFELGRGALTLSLPLGEATLFEWLGQVHYQDLWHPLAFGIIDN